MENAAPWPPGFPRTALVQWDGVFFQTGQKTKASVTAANHSAGRELLDESGAAEDAGPAPADKDELRLEKWAGS